MKDSRKGEALWSEWEGYGHEYKFGDSGLVFFTEEHVDIDHEVVKRALASTLQRDGIVHSLAEAFKIIDAAYLSLTYAGPIDGDIYWTLCDAKGVTTESDEVDGIYPVTLVEIEYP